MFFYKVFRLKKILKTYRYININKKKIMTQTLNSNNNNVDEPWSASINKTGNQHLIRSNSAMNNIEDEDEQTVHDSSLSIYERLRHFLYFNFVLNKRSFVLAILGYLSDLVLFVALSLYLFSNVSSTCSGVM